MSSSSCTLVLLKSGKAIFCTFCIYKSYDLIFKRSIEAAFWLSFINLCFRGWCGYIPGDIILCRLCLILFCQVVCGNFRCFLRLAGITSFSDTFFDVREKTYYSWSAAVPVLTYVADKFLNTFTVLWITVYCWCYQNILTVCCTDCTVVSGTAVNSITADSPADRIFEDIFIKKLLSVYVLTGGIPPSLW